MSARGTPDRGGFTLVEMLIAAALFGVVFAAVFALCSSAFGRRTHLLAGGLVHGDAALLETALSRAAASASYVESPSSGTLSVSELCLWENVSPDDGVSAVAAGARRYSYFCRTGAGQVFLHGGDFPRPAIVCGAPAAGVDLIPLVGGGSSLVTASVAFARPSGEDNVVLVDYRLDLPARPMTRAVTASGTLQLNVQGAMELP